jgi:anti-sigma B factor antagonist
LNTAAGGYRTAAGDSSPSASDLEGAGVSDSANQAVTVDVGEDGVIVVRGEVDMAAGPLLDAAIGTQEHDGPVVLDLGGVEFIDSSGLRSLLGASRRASARGSSVVLRDVSPEVGRLLDITGTAGQFNLDARHDLTVRPGPERPPMR